MGSFLGMAGASLFILGYFLLQKDKEFAKHMLYSLINFVAAALMLWSLAYEWNMGALINNAFWIVLSSYGLFEAVYLRKASTQAAFSHVEDTPPPQQKM